MKKNRILKLGLLALALTLVTASLVSGTFAKYVTTLTGTGTVQVAKWVVKAGTNLATETVNFNLLNTITDNTDVTPGLIAPGTSGKFTMVYTTAGTQVDHTVTISLDTLSSSISDLGYMEYSTNGTDWKSLATLAGTPLYTATFDQMAGPTNQLVEVQWRWPIGPDDLVNGTQNIADTADGVEGLSYNFVAVFNVIQLDGDPIG